MIDETALTFLTVTLFEIDGDRLEDGVTLFEVDDDMLEDDIGADEPEAEVEVETTRAVRGWVTMMIVSPLNICSTSTLYKWMYSPLPFLCAIHIKSPMHENHTQKTCDRHLSPCVEYPSGVELHMGCALQLGASCMICKWRPSLRF